MVRSSVDIAVEALDGLGLGDGASATGLEKPVDRLDTEPGGETLITLISGAFQIRELLLPLSFREHPTNATFMQLPSGIHLDRSLRQPHLNERGLCRSTRAGRPLQTGREL